MEVTSYDPTSTAKRLDGGNGKTIHQNQAISGINRKPDLNTEYNSTGNLAGAFENTALLGSTTSNPLKINTNLVGGG